MTDPMSVPEEPPPTRNRPTVRPIVTVDSTPLTALAASRLARVVVDCDLTLPGMFELTFLDNDGRTLDDAGIVVGSVVAVTGSGTDDGVHNIGRLVVGEVTAIEAQLRELTAHTVVRGYTAEHRLQRATRSRTFLNSTDSDVATQLAAEAGLPAGGVVATTTTHPYLAQVNQTDWDFLLDRAAEIGYEAGMSDGVFHFRPATSVSRPVAAAPEPVTFPDDLLDFRPRVTAGNLTPDVEVRAWDPLRMVAIAQQATTPGGSGDTPNSLGTKFSPAGSGPAGKLGGVVSKVLGQVAEQADNPATLAKAVGDPAGSAKNLLGGMGAAVLGGLNMASLGPAPSPTARITVDRPFGTGEQEFTAAPGMAAALGTEAGSTFAEAEGEAVGDPMIQPGVLLEVRGVPRPFGGNWLVSRAQHIFDDRDRGYRTVFSAHGRQDRSMLGLTSLGRAVRQRPRLDGVVCGVVSNTLDPLGKARIKVALPWLAPDFETDWAPAVQFVAGQRGGALFLPEVGDEVMLAFELGDPRRPYVLGGLVNNLTTWKLSTPPAQTLSLSAGGGMGGGMGNPMMGGGGMALGAAVGAAEGAMAADGQDGMGGSVQTPGMVGEVIQRGFVSSTGNCLMFTDQPLPGVTMAEEALQSEPGAAEAVGAASGALSGALGSSGGGGGGGAGAPVMGTGSALGALSSSVTVGTQNGAVALTMDQVNSAVSLTCTPVLGVSKSPLPQMTLAATDGVVIVSAGPAGTVEIDGGTMLTLKATTALNIAAPVVTVNGIPLPI
ncbi:phage baseplate assembly protein V [Amycolatopsis sp. WQ 127309]|uniref:phage baseplate assembly protein V n=1 Tax=Amycolatopsis sp. WQ 127309 TaxID=2932773 RepID=UPI001FF4C850|nr:phage baseplate assembly protein V [Amycolatopsis sp. WQ 127309]UOZ05636.1 phage baseplate assembly protein V [Amycolatopsis sp. WQ 127309]